MLRNAVVDAFEVLAWAAFIAVIGFCVWQGFALAEAGRLPVQPWMGALAGLVAGAFGAVALTGPVFAILDIRASLDRLAATATPPAPASRKGNTAPPKAANHDTWKMRRAAGG